MFADAEKLYTQEINAAVRGAKAAGATEIVVMDCHGAGGGWTWATSTTPSPAATTSGCGSTARVLPLLWVLSRLCSVVLRHVLVQVPGPWWLTAHSEPNIDALVGVLGDEARRLYWSYLADEVRVMRADGMLPAWRAFDRAMCEIRRRNGEGRQP